MRISLLATLCLALSACGIKGPLELPQRSSPVPQSHHVQAAPAQKPAASQSGPTQSAPAADSTEKQ